jgi:protein-disulfide isomerase
MIRATSMGVALVSLALASCVDPNDISEIKKNQKQILDKLDEVAKQRAAQPTPQQPQRPRGPDPSKAYSFDVGKSPVKGPNDAWVTIIEVSDFQCPFCGRVNPTLKEVQQKYGNDVRVVFKHNPLSFHPRAMPAAMAASCAQDQGKFWELHDKMFGNQQQLEDANLEAYAKEAGVDVGKWKSCVAGGAHKGAIENDQRTAMSLGANGTPAFFINGRFLSGAQPFPAFDALVGEELKKAQSSGMSKGEYYQKAVVEKGAKTI